MALLTPLFLAFFGYRFSTWFLNRFLTDFGSQNWPKIDTKSTRKLTCLMVGAALKFLRSQLAPKAHFCIDLWPSEPSFLNDPTVFLKVFTYFRASLWDHFLSDFWAPKSSKNEPKIRQFRFKNRPESDIKKNIWFLIDFPSKMTPQMDPQIDKKSTKLRCGDWRSALLNSTWPSWGDFWQS